MHKRLFGALSALIMLGSLAACGTSQPEPTTNQPSTSSIQTVKTHTATVHVEGTGVATDVTVTIIDPDTGLKPTQGTEGLEGESAAPTDSEQHVGDSKAQTDSNKNVQLPFAESYELTTGQKITVAAQNGTADSTITVTVTLDGHTVSQSASGMNTAVTATSKEAK
jgi:N-acetylmuramoyl-L-alanine amidase CwlA